MTNAAVPTSKPPSRRVRWILGIGAAALIALSYFGWVRWASPSASKQDQSDSRSSTSGRSLQPAVAFVGDEVCASCHKRHSDTYHHHPMGQSLRPVGDFPQDDRPEGNPFTSTGLRYRVERRNGQVFHREEVVGADGSVLAHTEAPVRFALGSGTRAISYLIDHEGTLTQSPITWFAETRSWALSPGFKGASDRFERPVLATCLFCHCNLADADVDTRSAYRAPIFQGYTIGCERCHGPGEQHARIHQSGEKLDRSSRDSAIVNPVRLEPALQEAICAQCHLGGKERVVRRGREAFDFQPGLPLEAFYRVFVLPPDLVQGNRVAGHVEQLHTSRCFQKSAGKFGCSSCHEAHSLPAPDRKDAYYRDQCLQCHRPESCTETLERRHAKSRDDYCTACHMPSQATEIDHMALTDHRIRRNPDPHKGPPVEPEALVAIKSLLPFGHDQVDTNDRELLRDLAIASVSRARSETMVVRRDVSNDFLSILSEAVRAHPDDLSARESLAVCLAWQGQFGPALDECEEILARAPRRELALTDAGVIAGQMRLLERSLSYWQRALAINPASTRYRFMIAQLLMGRGDWDAAAAECRRLLAQNGAHPFARIMLVQYDLRKGNRAEARAELEKVLALHPPNEAQLRQQFAELLR